MDAEGYRWECNYKKNASVILGEKGHDMNNVAKMMNENFDASRKNGLHERITIVTPGVEHHYSRYESIPGTKKSDDFLLIAGTVGVYYRRYLCLSCVNCRNLEFLKCTNEYCGEWKFFSFDLNSGTIAKLLTPYFGEKNQLFRLKKEHVGGSKQIMKLIAKYYKLLPNPLS